MVTDPVTVSPGIKVSDLDKLIKANRIDAVPVVEDGKLIGIIATIDVARLPEDKWPKTQVRDIMTQNLSLGYPDETLSAALNRMTEKNISHLPIVDPENPDKLIGFLAIHNIALTYDSQKKSLFEEKL